VIYGAIDVTYNVDNRNDADGEQKVKAFRPHWRPHLQLILRARDWKDIESAVRGAFPHKRLIPRPVVARSLGPDAACEAYLLKRLWEADYEGRRETYLCAADARTVTNSRQKKLRVHERLDLLVFLDRLSLGGRLVLINAKLAQAGETLRLRRVRPDRSEDRHQNRGMVQTRISRAEAQKSIDDTTGNLQGKNRGTDPLYQSILMP
jgi:hypothetical protein